MLKFYINESNFLFTDYYYVDNDYVEGYNYDYDYAECDDEDAYEDDDQDAPLPTEEEATEDISQVANSDSMTSESYQDSSTPEYETPSLSKNETSRDYFDSEANDSYSGPGDYEKTSGDSRNVSSSKNLSSSTTQPENGSESLQSTAATTHKMSTRPWDQNASDFSTTDLNYQDLSSSESEQTPFVSENETSQDYSGTDDYFYAGPESDESTPAASQNASNSKNSSTDKLESESETTLSDESQSDQGTNPSTSQTEVTESSTEHKVLIKRDAGQSMQKELPELLNSQPPYSLPTELPTIASKRKKRSLRLTKKMVSILGAFD